MATERIAGILTREQVLRQVRESRIRFEPGLDSFQIQQHSVDLRLGLTFRIPILWRMTEKGREALIVDYFSREEQFTTIELEQGQIFDFLPHEQVNATALERIRLPNDLMAIMFPRSSVTRRGLSVGLTGIIDAGYEGSLVVPIENNTGQAMRLYPGLRFCQLIFIPLSESIETVMSRWHKQDVTRIALSEKSDEEEGLIATGQLKKLKARFGINPS